MLTLANKTLNDSPTIHHKVGTKVKKETLNLHKVIAMSLETRKKELINWISSLKEESIVSRVEEIQHEKEDWWETLSEKDKSAINNGLEQLDSEEFISHSQVRARIKERFNL